MGFYFFAIKEVNKSRLFIGTPK